MIINLLQTPEYKTIMTDFIFKTITYLFDKDKQFSIACDLEYTTFNPELPSHIKENFSDSVLFILGGYAFDSASLDEKQFSFETGFGEENFGSIVSVPLLGIKQLYINDQPILFNLVEYTPIKKGSKTNSMESLLNNPENKKLLLKKK